MGYWDNPDSPENRRKQDAERRQRRADEERAEKKARDKAEKLRQEEKRAADKIKAEEDEKSIAEMQMKFQGGQAQHGGTQKGKVGLNRGPGFGGVTQRNQNIKFGAEPAKPGYNPNAPREGHEDEGSPKSGKSGADGSGVPKLPRPF
jgi:hypothetical protein